MGLIVNGLAMAANGRLERCELEVLYEVTLHTLHGAEAFLKVDIDKHDGQLPWRLLCLNHCIISTRSGNGERVKASYDLLITHLPEEAKAFFELALRKVNGNRQSTGRTEEGRRRELQQPDSTRTNLNRPCGAVSETVPVDARIEIEIRLG
jgi:hypothetical protein